MLHRLTPVALACWCLAGCGFQPLYGTSDGNDVMREFAYINIATIRDRPGQQLRNELVQRLHAAGRAPLARYRLETTLDQSIQSLAVRKSAIATRSNLTMTAKYRLVSAETGKVLFSAQEQATVSYNVLASEFATLMAERDARARAIRSLSNDIRLQLGVFFDRRPAPGAQR